MYRPTPYPPCGWSRKWGEKNPKQQSTMLTSSCSPPSQPPWQAGDAGAPSCLYNLESQSPDWGLTNGTSLVKGLSVPPRTHGLCFMLSRPRECKLRAAVKRGLSPVTPKCAKNTREAEPFSAGCVILSPLLPHKGLVSDSCYVLSFCCMF